MIERFWSHVNKLGPDECWEWTATKEKDGYGLFVLERGRVRATNRARRAHRVAYTFEKGEIPKGFVVMHKCDNRACCNPAHLEVGTQADNIRDMLAKGRARGGSHKGESNPFAKLNAKQASEIRQDSRTQAAVAAAYGISPSTVSAIKSGHIWAHS